MSATTHFRYAMRFLPLVTALAITGLTVACSDDDDDEPDVQTIRLVIGAQAPIEIDRTATMIPPIVITRATHNVTATFLRRNGQPETLVTPTEFLLRFCTVDDDCNTRTAGMDATNATYEPTGAFTGELTGVTVGNTIVKIQLYHEEEMHADFERSVTLTVQ